MRTVLAAAAAGALIMGSAAGAAVAKPSAKPAPQTTVKLQSVSIKGHTPIDLDNPATLSAIVPLRAKVWDPQRKNAASTVEVTLGAFTKKVDGEPIPGAPPSKKVTLTLKPSDTDKKVKHYALAANLVGSGLSDLWTLEQVTALDALMTPGQKAYICISTADVTLVTEGYSMQTRKRLDINVKKPVRDCVKVIDTVDVPPPSA